jgi:hypothetical protein
MRRVARAVLASALGLHFALVVAGAAHLTARVHGRPGRELRFYDALSGAGDSYAFFAPAVGPQLRVRFVGDGFDETLESGKSREVAFRLGNIASTVYIASDRQDVRRAFLGALAANAFGAHPDAHDVRVSIEEWVMPTMAAYRAGARPEWRALHEATFVRSARNDP